MTSCTPHRIAFHSRNFVLLEFSPQLTQPPALHQSPRFTACVNSVRLCSGTSSPFQHNSPTRCVPLAYGRPPPLAPVAVVPDQVTMLLYTTHATQQCKRSDEGENKNGRRSSRIKQWRWGG